MRSMTGALAVLCLLMPAPAWADHNSPYGSVAKLQGSWANFARISSGSTFAVVGDTIVLERRGSDLPAWFSPGMVMVEGLRYDNTEVSGGAAYHQFRGTCHSFSGFSAQNYRTTTTPDCLIAVTDRLDGTATFQSTHSDAKGSR